MIKPKKIVQDNEKMETLKVVIVGGLTLAAGIVIGCVANNAVWTNDLLRAADDGFGFDLKTKGGLIIIDAYHE